MLVSNLKIASTRAQQARFFRIGCIRSYSSKPPKTDNEIVSKRRIPGFTKTKISKLHGTSKVDEEIKSRGVSVKSRKSRKSEGDSKIRNEFVNISKCGKTPKYIPLKDFPKAPQSLLDSSLEELYLNIDLKPSTENTSISNEDMKEMKKKENFVDFNIPDKYLKSQIKDQITAKDKALVEELDNFLKSEEDADLAQSQLNMLKLYYDQESNSYQPLPEHTLKKSLSGMINLNPALVDIDDEYLWNIIPKDKLFGMPPFEEKIGSNAFKNWEKKMLEKEQKERDAKEINQKEFKEFEISLNKARSFFRKSAKGGRKKLDKQLMQQYKRLKKEGKIPKDFDLNFNDDD